MNNWLRYYYDIDFEMTTQDNQTFIFENNDYKYIFFPYIGDIKTLYDALKFSLELNKRGIYCHQIIQNKNKEIITNVNGSNYVLMVSYSKLDKIIDFDDIKKFMNTNLYNVESNGDGWKNLWEKKIDYFEYQISQFGIKYPLLRESFGYFSGFVETGISILSKNVVDTYTLSHRRINEKSTLYDLYNPLNMIIDNKIRDICEYYKSYIEKLDVLEVINFFENNSFSSSDIKNFFIRMLYPSFYFDCFEEIINNNLNEEKIKRVLENTQKYEKFIKDLYHYTRNYTDLPIIEWLN